MTVEVVRARGSELCVFSVVKRTGTHTQIYKHAKWFLILSFAGCRRRFFFFLIWFFPFIVPKMYRNYNTLSLPLRATNLSVHRAKRRETNASQQKNERRQRTELTMTTTPTTDDRISRQHWWRQWNSTEWKPEKTKFYVYAHSSLGCSETAWSRRQEMNENEKKRTKLMAK